jgi:Phage integrase, N-terminal SAM-like domain
MTVLRQRMLEDLRIRNYAPRTVEAYIRWVAEFSKHFHRPPDQLGPDWTSDPLPRLGFPWGNRPLSGARRPGRSLRRVFRIGLGRTGLGPTGLGGWFGEERRIRLI